MNYKDYNKNQYIMTKMNLLKDIYIHMTTMEILSLKKRKNKVISLNILIHMFIQIL